MLVSLLDEDNPPQSLPPPPHVGPSALPPNRILSSPVTSATPLPPSPITAQVPNSNHSTPLTLMPTYPKSSSSSDVLSHLLTSTGNIGVGGSNSTPIGANSSTQSLPPGLKSATNSETGVSKKGRKRRVDPSMGGFISTLPTRAAIMDAMKQPTKPTPSKPAMLAKESVYDFEDCPPSTNIAPPPPPHFPPPKPFAFSDVSAPERTAERKSGLKFVIKTNRGGSAGGLTAASATAATTPTENAAMVTKPRTKAVEGKPFALFKQMQQQQQPSTSSQHPKKERKRRVSSKSKEVQPSLVLSISSPKVFPSAPTATPAPSPKKHGLVKGKPGRKKTLSTSSEPKRNRLISDEPPIESGVVAPSSGVSGVGSSGGGNSTNRLIKGYKIPKVRKLPSPPSNNPPPVASQPINQEEAAAAAAAAARVEVTPTATAMPTPLLPPPPPAPAAPSTIPTTTTKSQQRSLLFIVENLKRAVVESSAAPQLHQQQTSSAAVVELARGSTEGSGDAANIAEDTLPADSNDNLFEKFSR